jgi:hypothetical protein
MAESERKSTTIPIQKKRAKKAKPPAPPHELDQYLGKAFGCRRSYCAPAIALVVGHTKSMVIIEHIDCGAIGLYDSSLDLTNLPTVDKIKYQKKGGCKAKIKTYKDDDGTTSVYFVKDNEHYHLLEGDKYNCHWVEY